MTDEFFIIATPSGVDRMVKTEKSATNLGRKEIPVKIKIKIDDSNWRPPYIEKNIVVDRWDKGVDVDDIDFETCYVTEEEAELIRQKRLNQMIERLETQGYSVVKDTQEDGQSVD